MAPKEESGKIQTQRKESRDGGASNTVAALSTSADPTVPTLASFPSIPATISVSARERVISPSPNQSKCKTCRENCFTYIYNRKKKTVCDRTCKSWFKIIGYSIMYLIFLTTYTMIFLFGTLSIIKASDSIQNPLNLQSRGDPYSYVKKGVGLHVTPTAENDNSHIQFRRSENSEYLKYIRPIDELLKRRESEKELISSLGPCGVYPYGYGDNPCIIIKIDNPEWFDEPLGPNSTLTRIAPQDIKKWISSGERKLWLHCDGYSPYDRDNIGEITYYPHPPGINPNVYPMGSDKKSPLLAVQFTKFTQDVSITVVCKLWHELGPSSVYFTLHVAPSTNIENNTSTVKQFVDMAWHSDVTQESVS